MSIAEGSSDFASSGLASIQDQWRRRGEIHEIMGVPNVQGQGLVFLQTRVSLIWRRNYNKIQSKFNRQQASFSLILDGAGRAEGGISNG